MQAGLSPTGIGCSGSYCYQSNVFDSKMLQTHHPESLRCLWGRATLCQTVGSNPAHHHGDPSIGECVQNLAALLIPHSLVCLPHTFLSVSLLLFLLFIGINLISLQNANDQKLGFHSKCCVLLAIDLGGPNFCLFAISSCCSLDESRIFTGNDCLKDTDRHTAVTGGALICTDV